MCNAVESKSAELKVEEAQQNVQSGMFTVLAKPANGKLKRTKRF